jgi:hypothetical protein
VRQGHQRLAVSGRHFGVPETCVELARSISIGLARTVYIHVTCKVGQNHAFIGICTVYIRYF